MECFKEYLHGRGITDEAIDRYGVSGDEKKVIIPIRGFNKYRTFPEKRYFYDKGFSASLFGVEQLNGSPWCVLTEGELDALRLASEGIPAVSGTGGAGTWKDEWSNELPNLVFICYDTDKAGRDNAIKVHHKIPGSRIVDIPEGKDVTEYLEKHSKEQFLLLLKEAKTIPKAEEPKLYRLKKQIKRDGTDIERAKQYPVDELIKFTRGKAPCIWHKEKTPSMHLYPDNHVYCFGCAKGGDAIAVCMTLENLSFEEAIKRLI